MADARSRLRRLAWLLDSSIRLPGGYRIGIDGLIGLLPGAGDLVAAGLSFYIVAMAVRLDVPATVVARMGLNVVLELLLGSVPVLGDVFDFAFKANERNVRLMDAYLDRPDRTRTQSRWLVVAVVAVLLLLLSLGVVIAVALTRLLWTAMTT